MSRALLVIHGQTDRQRVVSLAGKVPPGTRVEFKAAKRTLPMNDKLWAMLTDISRQVEWHGRRLTPGDWKDVFTASVRNSRVVPGIDPGTFVVLGLHTSDMSKDEFSDLLELMNAFSAEHGVVFQDQVPHAAERAAERPAAAQNVRSESGAGHGSRGAA